MIKHKFFNGNITKMENWFETMSKEGYVLTRVYSGCCKFEFKKISSGDFVPTVRIDYQTFKKRADFENYVAMFEDSGWRHIYGSYYSGTQIFQQTSPEVADDIFSDRTSKAERYKRISYYWLSLFCAYIPLLIVFQNTGTMNLHNLFHIKDLYLTPGLWERTGSSFWSGFLFETPFALGRALGGLLFFTIIFGYLYAAIKAYYWYNKEKKNVL